jgi:hypothetical protein
VSEQRIERLRLEAEVQRHSAPTSLHGARHEQLAEDIEALLSALHTAREALRRIADEGCERRFTVAGELYPNITCDGPGSPRTYSCPACIAREALRELDDPTRGTE